MFRDVDSGHGFVLFWILLGEPYLIYEESNLTPRIQDVRFLLYINLNGAKDISIFK
jgi:hypothetical protein